MCFYLTSKQIVVFVTQTHIIPKILMGWKAIMRLRIVAIYIMDTGEVVCMDEALPTVAPQAIIHQYIFHYIFLKDVGFYTTYYLHAIFFTHLFSLPLLRYSTRFP